MTSKYLNKRQMSGFLKLADIMLPGYENLPRFSDTGFEVYLDEILEGAPDQDRTDLLMLFSVFYFTPKIFIKLLLNLSEKDDRGPLFWQINMRKLNIGLKGIVFSLYYSRLPVPGDKGLKIFKEIGWDTQIPGYDSKRLLYEPDDLSKIVENDFLNDQHEVSLKVKEIYKESHFIQPDIAALTVHQRLNFIRALKETILKNQDEFVNIIHRETKKAKVDIISSEIFATLDFLNFLEKEAPAALKNKKVPTPIALMGKKSFIRNEALGIILIISPWNYPFFQAVVPIALALVCGNAVIYKPSEFTPLKGIVEKLLATIGLPKKWVQVVYGDGLVGEKLIEGKPSKIFFTGSVATGKKIMKKASENLIPVELELGGKDAMIVFDDINLNRATSGALWGGLTASGQSCTSVERVLVHENIFEEFKNILVEKAKQIRLGAHGDFNIDMGPMVTSAQVSIVADHVEDALSKGAKLLTGETWDRKSSLIPPLVLEGITPQMKIFSEETFGPVIPLITFNNEEQAIYLANLTEFGLTSSVWSKDLVRANRVADKLKCGGVSINNVMLTEGNPYLPFGGIKNSGIGRYKGLYGFLSFSNTKSIILNADSKTIEAHWFPFNEKKYNLFRKMMVGLFSDGIFSFCSFLINGLRLEGHANKKNKKLLKI